MKRYLIAYCLALAVATFSPPSNTITATTSAMRSAAPRHECEGNACRVATLIWDHARKQYCSQNNSDRWVKVEVTAPGGAASVRVPPGGSECLTVTSFEGPYRANFD